MSDRNTNIIKANNISKKSIAFKLRSLSKIELEEKKNTYYDEFKKKKK